jgi:uncharacterized membrane protein YgdD (TMEM256/DUF423 family)
MKKSSIICVGALLGLTSVMMAAYVDHMLAARLSVHVLSGVMTAVRYHQVSAIVICMLGFALQSDLSSSLHRWIVWSAQLFIIGVVLFSVSIYAAAMFDVAYLVKAAPYGGTLMMAGWICLMRVGWLYRKCEADLG